MIVGTCYFPSLLDALAYYRPQGFTAADIAAKLKDGEIHIGQPPIKPGDKLELIDNRTRWAIVEARP